MISLSCSLRRASRTCARATAIAFAIVDANGWCVGATAPDAAYDAANAVADASTILIRSVPSPEIAR
jgi:hypothetical protein